MTNDQCSRTHRSGFVNIVGNPNVGKSTLMNALVGERLSIITSKAQTTRHRIMGIVNGEDFQMVYSDTPGVLSPNYQLQRQMLEFSRSALVDADVLLYVTDVNDTPDKNADFLEKVRRMASSSLPLGRGGVGSPRVFLIINKIDLTTQETLENLVAFWHTQLPEAEIFPISAQERFGVSQLFDAIREALPVGPPFFPKDQLTDKSERFFVNEIIREKILQNYDKEIPYSVEVEVESFKEIPIKKSYSPQDGLSAERSFSDNVPLAEGGLSLHISAVIYCERESQKGIIIGKAGAALKRVGTLARRDIEDFLQRKVFLQLFVKVDRDWRSNTGRLKHYGYDLT